MKSLRHMVWPLIALLGVGTYTPVYADEFEGLTADMRPVESTGYKGRGMVNYFATGGGGVQASMNHNQRYAIAPDNAGLGMDTIAGAVAADVELVLLDESLNPYARCQLNFGQIATSPAGVLHATYKLTVRITRRGNLVGGPCVADMDLDPNDARPRDEIFPQVDEGDTADGVVLMHEYPIRALTGVFEE